MSGKIKLGIRHSRACLGCRQRRIKCDLEVPACSQCLRARKVCQGYRDEKTLMFRDGYSKRASSCDKVGEFSHAQGARQPETQTPNFPLDLSYPIKEPGLDRGIEFFYDNYISFVSNKPTGRAALPSSIAWHHIFTNPAFASACAAAGYADLYNVTKNRSYMTIARKEYARSMQDIRTNMNDPAKHAISMESAMILAVFEIVNAGAWNVHLSGGITLWRVMMSHGQAPQPRTQLYHVFYMFISCLLAERPVSPDVYGWAADMQSQLCGEDGYAAPLANLTSRFVHLYASVKKKTVASSIILHEACKLDSELQKWEQNMPPRWRYAVVTTNHKSAYQKITHQYDDFWLARMLMNYRWTRILLNNLILIRCAYVPNQLDKRASLATIARLSDDICHSVAYFLEPCIIRQEQSTPFPVVAGCFVVMFPLAVAGSAIGSSQEICEYVLKILQMLGDRLGIFCAAALIDRVQNIRKEWQSFAKLV